MSGDGGPVILAGTVRFSLDKLDAAQAVMMEMMRLSREEDGCIEYVYSEDLIHPGVMHVFEVWRDQAALDAHHNAPHFQQWKAERAALGMTDRKLVHYDVAATREG
jgi:quinol monooxygenase YgiN